MYNFQNYQYNTIVTKLFNNILIGVNILNLARAPNHNSTALYLIHYINNAYKSILRVSHTKL